MWGFEKPETGRCFYLKGCSCWLSCGFWVMGNCVCSYSPWPQGRLRCFASYICSWCEKDNAWKLIWLLPRDHWSFILGIFDRPTWVYEPSLTPGTKLCWRSRRSLLGDVFIGGSLHAPNPFLGVLTACIYSLFLLKPSLWLLLPGFMNGKKHPKFTYPPKNIHYWIHENNSRRDSLCTQLY